MNEKKIARGLESFLEITDTEGELYEYKMLAANEIEGLLPVRMELVDQQRKLVYTVSGYKTLELVYERQKLVCEEICGIMQSILKEIENVRRYLLVPDHLLLAPDHIYMDEKKKCCRFLYVPGYGQDFQEQMKLILEYLMGKTDPQDSDGILLVWKFYMRLKEGGGVLELGEALERSTSFSGNVFECQEEKSRMDVVYPESDLKEKKQREFDWFVCIRALVLVFLLILAAADGYWVYHIYRYGILHWKRNALIITTLLLICGVVLFFWIQKNQNIKKQLEELFFDS